MIALPAATPSSKFWPLRQSIRMIASTRPVPNTACRFPKNLSMAVPPVYRGAACDPVPVTQLCQPTGEMHHFLRSEEHTSELQSLMRISYAVFCLKKKKQNTNYTTTHSALNNTI